MSSRHNRLQRILLDHFWGKVQGAFITSIATLILTMLIKANLEGWANMLKVTYDILESASDIIGTIGLIIAIPSGFTYAYGFFFRGKYPQKSKRNF